MMEKVRKQRKQRKNRIVTIKDAITGEETFNIKVPSLKGSRGRPAIASKGATSNLKAARSKVEAQVESLRKIYKRIQLSSAEFLQAKQTFEESASICAAKAEEQAELQAEQKLKVRAKKRLKKEKALALAQKQREAKKAKKLKAKEAKEKALKVQKVKKAKTTKALALADSAPKRRGRPKGSKNKVKGESCTESSKQDSSLILATQPKKRGRPRKHPVALEATEKPNTGEGEGKVVKRRKKAPKEDESVVVTTYHMNAGGTKRIVKQREEVLKPSTESFKVDTSESKSSGLYQEYAEGTEPTSMKMLGHCGECGGWLTSHDKLSKFVVSCPFCGEKQRTSNLVDNAEEARNPRKDRYEVSKSTVMDEEEVDDDDVEVVEDDVVSALPTELSDDISEESAKNLSERLSDKSEADIGELSVEMESVVASIHPDDTDADIPFAHENPASDNFGPDPLDDETEDTEDIVDTEDDDVVEDDEGEAF